MAELEGLVDWLEELDFQDWLAKGVKAGWVSDVVCETHDGLPMTDEEQNQWEEGFDPCLPAVRVWGPR